MKLLISVILAAVALSQASGNKQPSGGKQWAILTTGATSYYNYGLEADIAHAYKILIRRGVPAENIIVIMADDVVYDRNNPRPGVLINKPNGPDVYEGIKIDYKGDDVSVKTFLAVLGGDKEAVKGKGTGKVLESGPDDIVFLNIVSHGGSGVVYFPNGVLHAEDLLKTLKDLTAKKKYAKLLIYLEACYSGSMFNKLLPNNTEILATTSAEPDEEAWFCYCNYLNYPCLGTYYSVAWMDQTDKKLPDNETVLEQYNTVKKLTPKSHVSMYGDTKLENDLVQTYIGLKNVPATGSDDSNQSQLKSGTNDPVMYYFKRMAKEGRNKQERMEYAQMASELEKNRKIVDKIFDDIVDGFISNNEELKNDIENTRQHFTEDGMKCQKKLYTYFIEKCLRSNKNTYALKHFYKLANVCELTPHKVQNAFETIDKTCDEKLPLLGDVY